MLITGSSSAWQMDVPKQADCLLQKEFGYREKLYNALLAQ